MLEPSRLHVRTSAPTPLVPADRLARADRILFVTHLAIGDFTYMQPCLRAFAAAYPHLEIHVWVDERRRTGDPAAWPHLQKYALFDWLAACPWIDRVYDRTYSPAVLAESIAAARAQDYPIVVNLTVLDCHRYARMARTISPRGFIAGLRKPAERLVHVLSRYASYRKLDAAWPVYTPAEAAGRHISDIYAGWFARCFGLELAPAARYPVLDIPAMWTAGALAQFAAWNIDASGPVVFVNAYSKSPDRTWPLERVTALIAAMQARPAWRSAHFIVNVVPEAWAQAQRVFGGQPATVRTRTHLFSAQDHFFQLPAVMRLCSLVISVETAVMHLANAVGVSVIALMRCTNPEWVPIDKATSTVIMLDDPDDWVTTIGVDDVLAVLDAGPAAVPSPLPGLAYRPSPRLATPPGAGPDTRAGGDWLVAR
jgi:heptosyltransferase III